MSHPESPDDPQRDDAATEHDDSVVSPPAYPAYSTPPPEGLATNEDG
ncbi:MULTISPECIES: hypothetical protein [Mycobacterium]|jgi:hypothetical protein|nr:MULTISPECIES: hypothetical protein [Mycobacterium]MBI2698682.1 hypothetical protein [Mycobacterium sp.]MBX9982209.1 hypothetical protein [Mycobacterium gordonae]MCV7010511.1 hypothetical protein [Mycobacterium gordonae]